MSANALWMAAPPETYRARRARLAAQLARPLVLFAGHAPARNYSANVHEFRPASSYTYFGGPPVEHAALVVEPGSDGDAGCRLLRPTPDPDDAFWVGEFPADAALAAAAGLRTAAVGDTGQLDGVVRRRETAAVIPPFVETAAQAARLGLAAASADELRAIVGLRLIKDEHELAAMRRAAAIGMAAQRAAWAAARPGRREADVAAAIAAVLTAHEARPPYTAIVTVHGEILHSTTYAQELRAGQLLLIDASAEERTYYANDITRTLPVGGNWTTVQRHFYETVLRANAAAMDACVPGRRWREIHCLAARVIAEGLVQAELLRGDPAELVARNAHAPFFPHGLGHLIGLDVHDMRDFGDVTAFPPGRERSPDFGTKYLRFDRDLAAGMTVTVEPGVYLVPNIWQRDDVVGPFADVVNRPKIDALLRDGFGGIRVEHTICVRETGGPEVLTAELPTAADAIAAAMR